MAHIVDYIVIAVFLAVCMAIGVYHGFRGKNRQTPEYYLLGNRHLQLFPVAISFFVTYQSAISLMGVPAEIYNYGTMIAGVFLGYCGSLLLSTFTIVPLIHPLGVTSAFEYLELRFHSRAVRLLGTGFSMLQTTLYMGITLYAPALALEAVANIPLWASVVIAGGVSIVYTAIGGIKSVVWTDAFQCLIVFCGTIAALIKGFVEIGHPDTFTKIIKEEDRLQFINFNFDPRIRHTTWGVLIGSFFTFLPNWCNQSSVQRISSLKTEQMAKCSFLMSIPFTIIYGSLLCLLGLVLFSYYNITQCDPITAGHINNANQLMPYFVFDVMKSYPGVPGIYISALFSGSLSTVSSGINSLAANTVEDLLKHRLMKYTKFQVTLVAKLAVVLYGGLAIGVAYAAQSLSGPVSQIAMVAFGACGGPVAGLFFLGALFPFANWIGAFSGGLISIIINLWISVGTTLYGKKAAKLHPNPISGCISTNSSEHIYINTTEPMTSSEPFIDGTLPSDFVLYNISYVWYGLIGFTLTVVVGIIISCFTGRDKDKRTDPSHLFPVVRRYIKKYRHIETIQNPIYDTYNKKLLELKELSDKEIQIAVPTDRNNYN